MSETFGPLTRTRKNQPHILNNRVRGARKTIGLVPDMGSTWHLLRLGRARALGVALLDGRISAQQTAEWGLIWSVADDADLDSAVQATAEVFKRSSPDAMTRIRTSIEAAGGNTLSTQLDLETEYAAALIPRNMAEGAAAFTERREPDLPGPARRTLGRVERRSRR